MEATRLLSAETPPSPPIKVLLWLKEFGLANSVTSRPMTIKFADGAFRATKKVGIRSL
jgi:hypothetical protein